MVYCKAIAFDPVNLTTGVQQFPGGVPSFPRVSNKKIANIIL
jgi:hypothetical protein